MSYAQIAITATVTETYELDVYSQEEYDELVNLCIEQFTNEYGISLADVDVIEEVKPSFDDTSSHYFSKDPNQLELIFNLKE